MYFNGFDELNQLYCVRKNVSNTLKLLEFLSTFRLDSGIFHELCCFYSVNVRFGNNQQTLNVLDVFVVNVAR